MLDNTEYRALIRWLHLQGNPPKYFYERISAVYGGECATRGKLKKMGESIPSIVTITIHTSKGQQRSFSF